MNNQFDRQIIQEFFQKCIEVNVGNNPDKSAEIEEHLEIIEKEIWSLKRKIQDSNFCLQSLTFNKYCLTKIKHFFNKNSLAKELKKVLKDNTTWLLLVFTILILFLVGYLILVASVILLFIIFFFLRLLDKFKNEQDKLKQIIQLAITEQHSLESTQQSLKRDQLIKEKEYIQYRKNEEQEMFQLEQQVERILQSDKNYVFQKSARTLNIDYSSKKNRDRPIILCTGIINPSRKTQKIFHRGQSLVANRDLAEIEKLYEESLVEVKFSIPSEGLKNPFSGRTRYYQFYRFEIIFLGSDFLCYYSCLWDFLRGDSVDVTTVEYLYDSIASIKTQERSSLRQKSSTKKRIYWDMLSISTFDGTVLYIRQEKDRSDTEEQESELNKAAREIRLWLRRRKEQTYNKQ